MVNRFGRMESDTENARRINATEGDLAPSLADVEGMPPSGESAAEREEEGSYAANAAPLNLPPQKPK